MTSTRYSVSATAKITGINPQTLRAWERRHEAVAPVRDASGRRQYDETEVARLCLLRELTEAGHSIRHLAGLDLEALRRLRAGGATAAAGATDRSGGEPASWQHLLEAARAYDVRRFDRLLGRALVALSPTAAVEQVLIPLLRTVGDQWHSGELDIAQERLVSSAVAGRLLSLIHQPVSHSGPQLLLATLPGENHSLGLLMLALLAVEAGVSCRYLGLGLPAREIARMADGLSADAVAISVIAPTNAAGLLDDVVTLHRLLPGHTRLWLGGQAAAVIAGSELPAGVETALDLEDSVRLLASLGPAS